MNGDYRLERSHPALWFIFCLDLIGYAAMLTVDFNTSVYHITLGYDLPAGNTVNRLVFNGLIHGIEIKLISGLLCQLGKMLGNNWL